MGLCTVLAGQTIPNEQGDKGQDLEQSSLQVLG